VKYAAAPPELSVIVPCLGHAEELHACLAALSAQDSQSVYEVIVVDSASDDQVAAAVSKFPVARLVRSEARLAPGPARNLGVSIAAAELLVFTDADCSPEPGFLRAARATLDQGARLATGPVVDAPGGFIAACDNLLQFVDFSAGRPAGPAQYAPGCNLAIRKADFLAASAFPDGGAEDSRLSIAVAELWPGRLMFNPEMRVKHFGRPTLGALIEHHRSFGLERARHRVHLERWHLRLGRYRIMMLPIAAKRLAYLVSRTLRWNPRRLAIVLCFAPVLIVGLVAWASGFRAGLVLDGQDIEMIDD
jgi:glycosyltransferase involved in cell wall biosynthesis